MAKQTDPYLFYKYNRGLGDFIASTLHSNWLGWLTKLVTGKTKPCSICSRRADALNVLFPIPFWRLFFKTQEEMLISLNKDLEDAGYQTAMAPDKGSLASMMTEFVPNPSQPTMAPFNFFPGDEKLSQYTFISSNDREVDHILIRTQIFKKN